MFKPVPLTALFSAMLALFLLAMPANVIAGPVETFHNGMKVQRNGIRNTINSVVKQRAKNKYQKAVSNKYTKTYNGVYSATGKYLGSDTSKMKYVHGKHPHKSTVSSYIKTFKARISKLKKLQRTIKHDIARMDKDKNNWWDANGKYFDGKRLSSSKLRTLAYWVHFYGTQKGNIFGMKYHTKVGLTPNGVARQYTGGMVPEKTYLKKLSNNIGRVINVYNAALHSMERRLAQLKGGKKKLPPSAPPVVPDVGNM